MIRDWHATDAHAKHGIVCDLKAAVEAAFKLMADKDCQFELYGSDHLWIMKPGTSSRGRGIYVYSCLDTILDRLSNNRDIPWVVQKYMENSLLVKGRKFDIRQWVGFRLIRF